MESLRSPHSRALCSKMKIFTILILALFSGLIFAEDTVDVTGRVTMKEAVALGAEAKISEGKYFIDYKVKFENFKVCAPKDVIVQAVNPKGSVQLHVKLISSEGWYTFSIGLNERTTNRILIWCKSGDRNMYWISL